MVLPVNKSIFEITLCICVVLELTISASGDILAGSPPDRTEIIFNVSGLMAEALTSINDDYSVNLTGIPAYVNYLHKKGIKSVLVGATSGEHMFLSVRDRKQMIKEWVNATRDIELHVQVQVGGAPFADVIELAEYSAVIGVDSILTLPDLYQIASTPEELVSYVERVAKAAPNKPILYYHYPERTHVNVKMPDFLTVATHQIPNFKGIKFTSDNLPEALEMLEHLQHDQKVFLGEHLLAPGAVMGFDSFASPVASVLPDLMMDTLDAVNYCCMVKNDQAREWQRNLSTTIFDIASVGGMIPALKVALEYSTGIKMGPPALPAKPLTDSMKRIIQRKINDLQRDFFL